jgi:endonuclease-3
LIKGAVIMAKSRRRKVDWAKALRPLFKKYKRRKHPLGYENRYQLIAMVILSAQSTDDRINELAPALFAAYPTLGDLAEARPEEVFRHFTSVRGCIKKANWLISLAKELKSIENIPMTMAELTQLPGIGRKSANVIIRESGGEAEGVIVDLHVLRVASRLGIAGEEDPKKVEKQLMEEISQKDWNAAGMAFSFLGREICRPTDPKCSSCVLNRVCAYYTSIRNK